MKYIAQFSSTRDGHETNTTSNESPLIKLDISYCNVFALQ